MLESCKKIFLSATLILTSLCSSAIQTEYYATKSALATGHWAKVKVTENGINQLTYDQLREAGFENPEKVTVFGYGGAILSKDIFSVAFPDDLKQIYAVHNGDRILFYGEPDVRFRLASATTVQIDRNFQATAGYYFITDGYTQTAPIVVPYLVANATENVTTHTAIQVDQPCVTNLSSGGANFFSENAVGKNFGLSRNFSVADRAPGASAVVNAVLIMQSPGAFKSTCVVNGNSATYNRTSTPEYFYNTNITPVTVDDATITRYGNRISFNYTSVSSANTYAGYDYISVVYSRLNSLGDKAQLQLAYPSASITQRFILTDLPDGALVWFVKNPYEIRPFELREVDEGMAFGFDRSYTGSTTDENSVYIIAFDPSKEQYRAEIVGDVENQDIHSLPTPDLLIITNDLCQAQAERLADIHRNILGQDVVVLNQRNVFNEFSSGTPSTMAYRRVAKMFYDRNTSKLKNLLIFGTGTFDNRHILPELAHLNESNCNLTYQVLSYAQQRSGETNYCNDDYFGMLDDNYKKNVGDATYTDQTIGVGRIPADNEEKARIYVDKVEAYLTGSMPSGAYSRMLMLSDDGDSDSHASTTEDIITTFMKLNPLVMPTKVYDGFYVWKNNSAAEARRKIKSALNAGTGLFFYTGHGKPDAFTATNLWHRMYAQSEKYAYTPVCYLSTCWSYGFDRQENSIAENMIFSEGGGNIAVIGAGRSVYQNQNDSLAKSFFRQYAAAGKETTIGELFRKARNAILTQGSAVRINTNCYNVAGDPAIPVNRPNLGIDITSINGEAVGESVTLTPLTKTVIAGNVTDTSGNFMTDFNGMVTITVYDGPTTQQNLYQDNAAASTRKLPEITVEDDILCEFPAEVVNGKFSAEIVIPAPARPDTSNKIFVGASSDDNKNIALTVIDNAVVTDINPELQIVDTNGPAITDAYINSPSFSDGDLITNSATFHATISDESGINVASTGTKIRLVVDNTKSFSEICDVITYNADGTVSVVFPMTDLSDGVHTVRLIASDNIGNISETELHFTFVSVSSASLTVDEEPAVTQATINLSGTFSGDATADIVIETISGKTVHTARAVSFPYVWNLTDNDGENVPVGIYDVHAKIYTSMNDHTTAKARVTVVK